MERAVLDDELIQGEKDLNQDLIDFLNSKEWKKFYYEIDLYLTFQPSNPQSYLEIVMNEMRKNQNFHFNLQIHPTLINSTYLHCQMTGFIPIRVQNFQNVE